jgi:hypothetical protein
MAAVAKNPGFAKKAGVPSAVGKEFLTADKGKTFKEGGTMKKMVKKMSDGGMPMVTKDGQRVPAFAADGKGKMAKGGMTKHEDIKMDKKVVKKAVGMHDKQQHGGKKTNLSKLARGGGVEMKGKTKGKMIKMNKGGKSC